MNLRFAIDAIFTSLSQDNPLMLQVVGEPDIPILGYLSDGFLSVEKGGGLLPEVFECWSKVVLLINKVYTLGGVGYVVVDVNAISNSGEALVWKSRLSKQL